MKNNNSLDSSKQLVTSLIINMSKTTKQKQQNGINIYYIYIYSKCVYTKGNQ